MIIPYPRRTFIAPLIRGGEVLLRRAVTLVGAERELTGESLFSLSLSLSLSPLSLPFLSAIFLPLRPLSHTYDARINVVAEKKKENGTTSFFHPRVFRIFSTRGGEGGEGIDRRRKSVSYFENFRDR